MINTVTLVGRLTRDVELRVSQSNVTVATFTLAVNRQFKNSNGEREADFINCVAFKKTAEILNQYAGKGSQIGVTGSIQTRNYENKDGQRVYVTEVIANNIALLDSKGANNDTGGQQSQSRLNTNQAQQRPTAPEENPFANSKGSVDISDEMPF
jgi:single-strand DNA-binding protein